MSSIPTLYIDHNTNTAVQVRAAFAAALADDILENVEEVSCVYDMMDDSVIFTIKRRRDGAQAKMPIKRELLRDAEPRCAVAAMRADPEAFAKLILFLA